MKLSVMLPFATSRPEQILPFASLVEWTHVARLWAGQSTGIEPHQGFAHLAGSGIRVPVGIGVTLMPLRHPYEAALQAVSLARVTGHAVTVGYGPGALDFQRALRGAPYSSQLGAVRDYLTILRGLTRGGEVAHDGEHYSFRGQLGAGPAPRVEVGAGVLRPGMARVAGGTADAAITWLTPASYVAQVLRPALAEGAEEAGRTPPRVVAMVPVALAKRSRQGAEMALASNGTHLALPHYRAMLARAGVDLPGTAALDDAAALVDAGAFVYGDAGEIADRLAEYAAAGVDEVVLNLTGVHRSFGAEAALDELRALL